MASLERFLALALFLLQACVSARIADSRSSVWIITLHPQLSSAQLPPWSPSLSRADRRHSVASVLEETAKPAQDHVRAVIRAVGAGLFHDDSPVSSTGIQIEPLWIQNALIVRLAPELVENRLLVQRIEGFLLDQLPWVPSVVHVERDSTTGLSLLPVDESQPNTDNDNASGPQKNIRLVHAPELWTQAKLQGHGVTIASIDSGVRYTHEALAANFRGSRGPNNVSFDYAFWFPTGTDITKETPDTADPVGHGTHTVGTAVGSGGIGVAPQATWIAARAFDIHGAVSKSDFLLATQWVLCPTRVDGRDKNCSLGADVITGSFGVDRSDTETYKEWTWLTHVLQVWRAAGSYAVFASGNTNGFKCGSVYYPGSRTEAVAVGALLGGSTLWGASGKGPSVEEDGTTVLKPDFVAPGGAIRSALSTTDTAYTRMTGTSMATPHVTGLLALLLSGETPSSHPDLVAALQQTATHTLSKPFLVPSKCGGTKYNQFPNNIYGYGLPNVCSAATRALGVNCTSVNVDNDIETVGEWHAIMSVE